MRFFVLLVGISLLTGCATSKESLSERREVNSYAAVEESQANSSEQSFFDLRSRDEPSWARALGPFIGLFGLVTQ